MSAVPEQILPETSDADRIQFTREAIVRNRDAIDELRKILNANEKKGAPRKQLREAFLKIRGEMQAYAENPSLICDAPQKPANQDIEVSEEADTEEPVVPELELHEVTNARRIKEIFGRQASDSFIERRIKLRYGIGGKQPLFDPEI